jgi:hypothetical protein
MEETAMEGARRSGRRSGAPALNARGQVTVPRHLRQALRIGPGSEVLFVVDDRGEVVLRAGERHPGARPREGAALGWDRTSGGRRAPGQRRTAGRMQPAGDAAAG